MIHEMTPRPDRDAVTIKKYANRRLYNTATSTYVTLDDLCKMVKDGVEFNVYDAKTSEDITRSVLTQIIVEEESKGGQNLLPINFLRQLIGFYGGDMQNVLPRYLDQSMAMFAQNQERFTHMLQSTFGQVFPINQLEEIGKQNMAMFERAMKMFAASFGASAGQSAANPMTAMMQAMQPAAGPAVSQTNIQKTADKMEALQQQLNDLQKRLQEMDKTKT